MFPASLLTLGSRLTIDADVALDRKPVEIGFAHPRRLVATSRIVSIAGMSGPNEFR